MAVTGAVLVGMLVVLAMPMPVSVPLVMTVRTVAAMTIAVTVPVVSMGSMMFVIPVVVIVAVMLVVAVMQQRAECDKGYDRADDIVTVMRVGGCAGHAHGQRQQAAERRKLQVFPLVDQHFKPPFLAPGDARLRRDH